MENNTMEDKLSKKEQEMLLLYRAMKRRKRRKIILIILGCLIVLSSISAYILLKPKDYLPLKTNNVIVVELGEQVTTEPSFYLDNKHVDKDVVKNVKVIPKTTKNKKYIITDKKNVVEEGKNYLDVGKYELVISYKKEQKKTIKIEIVDTVKPAFDLFKNTIEIEQGTNSIDYLAYYQASDLSEVAIKIDDKKVKLNEVGTYEITVTAKDTSGNKTTKTANVKVNKKEEQQEPVPEDNTNQSSNNTPVVQQPIVVPSIPSGSHPPNKNFLFTDGYNMDTVTGACASYIDGYNGSCYPIRDASGTLIGMSATFK